MSGVCSTLDRSNSKLLGRLLSRKAGSLLTRNAIASCLAFGVGLLLMWFLVQVVRMEEIASAGVSFIAANSLHYVFARVWVFPRTRRAWGLGYGYFLLTAVLGLGVTVLLFAICMNLTSMNYLAVRVMVSVVVGIIIFGLNATLNFKEV